MSTDRCPRCGSPDPKRHPAVQFEGEVQICPDPFHSQADAYAGRRRGERESFVKALGLEFLDMVTDRGTQVDRWHWPKAKNGTKYDRTVIITIHPDESWSTALEANASGWQGRVLQLQAMVDARL